MVVGPTCDDEDDGYNKVSRRGEVGVEGDIDGGRVRHRPPPRVVHSLRHELLTKNGNSLSSSAPYIFIH